MSIKYRLKDFKLLKSFIQSEFSFQQKFLKKKRSHTQVKKIYSVEQHSLSVLDPTLGIKSVKQLIRLFQFFKGCNESNLNIIINNRPFDFLLYFFLKRNNLKISNIKTNLDSDLVKEFTRSKIVVALNCFLNSSSDIFHKSENNFNISYKVNAANETNSFQSYKLHNDIDSFKKFVYLLIILKQSLKKHKNQSINIIKDEIRR